MKKLLAVVFLLALQPVSVKADYGDQLCEFPCPDGTYPTANSGCACDSTDPGPADADTLDGDPVPEVSTLAIPAMILLAGGLAVRSRRKHLRDDSEC